MRQYAAASRFGFGEVPCFDLELIPVEPRIAGPPTSGRAEWPLKRVLQDFAHPRTVSLQNRADDRVHLAPAQDEFDFAALFIGAHTVIRENPL